MFILQLNREGAEGLSFYFTFTLSEVNYYVIKRQLSVLVVDVGADLHRERGCGERVVQGDRQTGDSYQYDRDS